MFQLINQIRSDINNWKRHSVRMEPHSLPRHVIIYIYIYIYIYIIVVKLQEGESLLARNCHSLGGQEGVEDTSLELLG